MFAALVAILTFAAFNFGQSCNSPELLAKKALVSTFSDQQKIDMWTEDIGKKLNTLTLTAEQQRAVKNLAKLVLTPAFFALSPEARRERAALAIDQLQEVMSRQEIYQIFNNPDTTVLEKHKQTGLFRPLRTEKRPTTSFAFASYYKANYAVIPDCNCLTIWGGNCEWTYDYKCVGMGSVGCTPIINCGPFWILNCNGMCQYVPGGEN